VACTWLDDRIEPGRSLPLYLTKRSIPELSLLPTAERDAVWNAARRRALGRWELWLTLLVFTVAAYGLLVLLRTLEGGAPIRAIRVLLAIAFGAAGGLAFAQIGIRLMRPYIRAALEARRQREG